ncbi:MAG TPA: hypothetical protein GYA08_00030 [Chloroflexi bacterium]|nr:hypothetical protein [Chloroflexota bacterium]
MTTTVAEMTKEELQELIGAIVEEKLLQLFADPDEGLHVQDELRDRLLRQERSVAAGERGQSLDDVLAQLELDAQ